MPLVLVVLGLDRAAGADPVRSHMYAVGGNPEAARRAGINVSRVRMIAFILCSLTAGIAGDLLLAAGRHDHQHQRRPAVLYAVAAAVIGGTSLFGGRGRAIHGLLGGLVIGVIYNGLYMLGLLAAVAVDCHGPGPAGGRDHRCPVPPK